MANVTLCKDALEYFKKVKKHYITTMIKVIIPLIALILVGVMAFVLNLFQSFDFLIFLVIGLSVITLLVVLATILFYQTQKPLYDLLIKEFLKTYNYDNSTSYKSTTKPLKQEKAFLKSYLFPKRAYMRNYALIENDAGVNLYDCNILIGNGQYTQRLFDGFYIQIKKPSDNHFQLRSKGKPSSKEVVYEKVDTLGAYSVYVETGHEIGEAINKLYQQITKLSQSIPFKHIYISQTNDTLHIALELKMYRRAFRSIECPTIDYYEGLFFKLLAFIDTQK